MSTAHHAVAAVTTIGNGAGHEQAREDLADATADVLDAADALLAWLDAGGFLPTAWQEARVQAETRKEFPFFS